MPSLASFAYVAAVVTAIYILVATLLILVGSVFGQQSHVGRLVSFYGRALAAVGAMCASSMYGVFASIFLRAIGKGGLSQWTVARSFKWGMWLVLGVWFEVEDPEDWLGTTRPCVIVGNHQTELDVLMLGHIFPKYTSVTAKRSLAFVPFLGWFMFLSKSVFIDRANRSSAVATFDSAAKTMRNQRQNVYIFPEGTRSYTDKPEMLPFKKGAFHLAVQAQVPIIPVVVQNYSHVLSLQRKIFRPGRIRIKVLKPIPTEGLTSADVPQLTQQVRDQMLAELILLSPPKPNGDAATVASSTGVDTGKQAANAL